ncbi:hypothetical protein HPB47_028394 [Ixodes persulcatus]|uniref:Uncharacterized protein n=1 Tax=Ixodes persulcatus TaxID=34615 RepID=A0AC60QZK5_IXOPE|nr:hypothetical protein HPB47_028394 [Ixodes persulcatus]
MKGLPERLKSVEGIIRAIYADDLTVWTTAGSAGTKQDELLETVYMIEAYLRDCGLACAPEETDLLLLKKQKRGRTPPEEPDLELTLSGVTVTNVNTIRILGLNFQGDETGTTTVERLQATVSRARPLGRRVVHRKHGLKKQDSLRLVQALNSYLGLTKAETRRSTGSPEKTYKLALELPQATSKERIIQLEVYKLRDETE